MQKYLLSALFLFTFLLKIESSQYAAPFNQLIQRISALNNSLKTENLTLDDLNTQRNTLEQYSKELEEYLPGKPAFVKLSQDSIRMKTDVQQAQKNITTAQTNIATKIKELSNPAAQEPSADFSQESDDNYSQDTNSETSNPDDTPTETPISKSLVNLNLSDKTKRFITDIFNSITKKMLDGTHIPEENFDIFIKAIVDQTDSSILDELQIGKNGKTITQEPLLQIATLIITTSNIEPKDAASNTKIVEQMKMLDAVITCKKAYVKNAFSDFWDATKKLVKTALIKNPLSKFINKLLTNASGDRQVRLIKSAQTIEQALAIEDNFIKNYKTTAKKGGAENDQQEIGSALGTALEKKFQELFNKAIAIRDRATLYQLKNLALTNEMVKDRKLVTPEMLTEIDTALKTTDSYNPRSTLTNLRRPQFDIPKQPTEEPKKIQTGRE